MALGLAAFAGLAVPLGAAMMLFLLHGGSTSSDGQADVPDTVPAAMTRLGASTATGIDLPHPGAIIGLTDAPAGNLLFAVGGGNAPLPDEDANAGNAYAGGYPPGTGTPRHPRHPDHPQPRSPFGLGPHGGPMALAGGVPTGGSRAPSTGSPDTGSPGAGSPGSAPPGSGAPQTDTPVADSRPPASPNHGTPNNGTPNNGTPNTGSNGPDAPVGNGGPGSQNDPAGNPPGGGQPPGTLLPTGNDPQLEPAINPPAQAPVVNTVPEPGALALVFSALGLLGWQRRKR